MELHDEDPRKIRSLNNAIFNLERFNEKLSEQSLVQLKEIGGVGESIAKSILEICEKGTFQVLEDLKANTPEGIIELIGIRGVGLAKIKSVWKLKNIDNPADFLTLAQSDELTAIKGFGEKTVEKIKDSLVFYLKNKSKLLISDALYLATEIVSIIEKENNNLAFSISGQVKRKAEIVDKICMVTSSDRELVTKTLRSISDRISIISEYPKSVELKLDNLYFMEIIFSSEELLVFDSWYYGVSVEHLVQMRNAGLKDRREYAGKSETEIYSSSNLHLIPEECRETPDLDQWKLTVVPPKLIEMSEMKGMLHCHSYYSDGHNSLREMAEACIERGYEYLGICDHSKSAFYYANGMFENRVLDQHKEIEQLNQELAPFKIFKGIESDILPEGDLDYEMDFLNNFDFVVASVHSVLNMGFDKSMNRLMKTIRNPHTTILGHLTGRILLERNGFPIDHKVIIDACAEYDVGIEINAHPSRLDMDWRWVSYAMNKGVMISINPDAHSVEGLDLTEFGVIMGRKAGLLSSATLNTKSLPEAEKYFKERKRKKGLID